MDAGETDTGHGAGTGTISTPFVDEDGAGSGAAPMIGILVAFRVKRARPRLPRPRRRRAVVRPPAAAAGSDHGARRTKEFMQWREWYLRKQRREKAWFCYAGIPPPGGTWI